RAAQPEARIMLHVGIADGDLDPIPRIYHCRHARQGGGGYLPEREVKKLPLVVREEALLLRVPGAVIAGEVEADLFTIDLHFTPGQRGLKPVSRAFIEGAEDNCIVAFHLKPQFIVAFPHSRELLVNRRLDLLVEAAFSGGFDLRLRPELLLINVDRERGVLEQGYAVEQHVIAEAVGGADAHLDPAVRRMQTVA